MIGTRTALTMLGAVLALSAPGTASVKQSAQTEIAYVREDMAGMTAQNGDLIGDIYAMNADGSGKRRLTRNADAVDESRLVTRRAEHRLHEQPQRDIRSLAHERRWTWTAK